MNEQEQQVAIAEACGWQDVVVIDDGIIVGLPPGFTEDQCPEGADKDVPDYLHDLNAMHEAEKTLPYEEQLNYFRTLEDIVDQANGSITAFAVGKATAAQRAEAFLRAIGKWKETS